ncbi:MAG: hypothetical protein Q8R48_00630, partial [Candidatus Omnitrophota bacterium]|nr:hypothetical protein [Candidatus Omnitrophota bacterium]
ITSYVNEVAGGSGGGVLIKSSVLNVAGTITANGGNGGYQSGGGGGGRIKIFYERGANATDLLPKLSVTGGTRGGYLNTANGGVGTLCIDAIPDPPALVAPSNGASLSTNIPTFTLNVADQSAVTDFRDDDLICIIELSIDNFNTIYKTYNQNVSLSGWSKFSYKTGDTAQFTAEGSLPQGVYEWRAYVRDGRITGKSSIIRSFTVLDGPIIEPPVRLPDIIVDLDTTVSGGDYHYILVKNNGILTISGNTTADQVYLEWGTMTFNGNLDVSDSITIPNNASTPKTITVTGNNNSAESILIYSGTLNMLGTWNVNNMLIGQGGKADVITVTETKPSSGTLTLNCDDLTVDTNGLIDATGDGADPRGAGNDWYRDAAAGGYGGRGGRGYWDSSAEGGYTYGDQYSFTIETGSRGGYYGGGSIIIITDNSTTINGAIKSDGITSYVNEVAGGSGGGILIKSRALNATGTITANGGNGGYYSGGGGGGRIKIFYERGISKADLLPKLSVTGGLRGGYLNTANGGVGTIWLEKTFSTNLSTRWNFISIPGIADDPNVTTIFAQALSANPEGIQLQTYDAALRRYLWYPWYFTTIEPGKAYWLKVKSPVQCIFKGADITTDFLIPLYPGWNSFGQPFNHYTYVANLKFTKDAVTKTFADAISADWVESVIWRYENSTNSFAAV